MTTPNNPLTPDDCANCNKVLEANQIARELTDKLKACGLPCQELYDQMNAQDKMAQAFKAQFFPGER
jgi:hypothetical protein